MRFTQQSSLYPNFPLSILFSPPPSSHSPLTLLTVRCYVGSTMWYCSSSQQRSYIGGRLSLQFYKPQICHLLILSPTTPPLQPLLTILIVQCPQKLLSSCLQLLCWIYYLLMQMQLIAVEDISSCRNDRIQHLHLVCFC